MDLISRVYWPLEFLNCSSSSEFLNAFVVIFLSELPEYMNSYVENKCVKLFVSGFPLYIFFLRIFLMNRKQYAIT